MRYIEVSIDEAIKRCKKNAKVLVAEQDLENDDCEVIFVTRENNEYDSLFENIKTAASKSDDLVKQLLLFTEKQNIPEITPKGVKKIILMTK